MTITKLEAIEIILEDGRPTLEISLTLDGKFQASSIIHLGSKDKKGDIKKMYDKVRKEKSNIENFILKGLWNKDFKEQLEFDEYLDKFFKVYEGSGLDANITFAISSAFLKASAFSFNLLPYEYIAEVFQTSPQIPKPIIEILKNTNENCLIESFYVLSDSNKFRNNIKAASILQENSHHLNKNNEGYFENDLLAIEEINNILKNSKEENKFKIIVNLREHKKEELKLIEESEVIKGLIFEDHESFNDRLNLNNIELIFSFMSHSNQKEELKDALSNAKINGVIIDISKSKHISDTFFIAHMCKSLGCNILIKSLDISTESFCSNLAFGLGCDYVMFGDLKKLSNAVKYNGILRIENSIL